MNIEKQIEKIQAGTVQIISLESLKAMLQEGRKLKVKFGADPTSADLHLGHAVVLCKLRDFQDLGHEVIFLIGDYTARIGDPSQKSKTRPLVSQQEIEANMQTYFKQAAKILDPAKTTVCYNSEWLDALTSSDFIKLCAKVTLAQLIERDDFAKRIKENKPIAFHELLYPLLQAYDSVALKADVELGGTDQTFNLLLGRDLQEQSGQKPQVVVTMPLLEGLDGVHKMSKSLGNVVGLHDQAQDAFGKLMSISDELMWRYYLVLLNLPQDELNSMMVDVAQGKLHPMVLKKRMAHDIVAKFWSAQEADNAQAQFETLFQKRDHSAAQEVTARDIKSPIWIIELLKQLNLISSTSDGKRLIEQGAVSINGQVIKDFKTEVGIENDMIIKAGKHKIVKLKL